MGTLPESAWLAPLVAALAATALAVWILVRPWAETFHRLLALVLLLTAVVEAGDALVLLEPGSALFWRQVALSAELLRMAALLLLGASLIGHSAAQPDATVTRRARVGGALALAASVVVWGGAYVEMEGDYGGLLGLGPLGRPLLAILLTGLVLAIAQLESVLRASGATFRYRINFVLLGAGALAGFEVYVCAQGLLLGAWRMQHAFVGGVVALVSVGLITFGLGRMRLVRTLGRVAVSSQMVYGSFTLVGVGLYLLGVGVVGEMLRVAGRPLSLGVAELLVFALTVLLVVGVSSRAVRARFRLFVSRHFLRSRYDYRTKWLEVTDAFRAAESSDEILDQLLELLARTFGTGRISVWSPFEADGRFHQVRSTNIEPPPEPLAGDHPLVAGLEAAGAPVEMQNVVRASEDALLLEQTEAVLAVPVLGAGKLLAFVLLGPGPDGRTYDLDDKDLLRAIAHHVGVLLAHAGLADERQAAAEIDALNRFSAFYLHDFKNLTARLSLVAQNAEKHGEDPEFRRSAMSTVGRTARQMSELIARLTSRSPTLGPVQPVDVEDLARGVVRSLGPDFGAEVVAAPSSLPRVLAVPEQLQQVVLNLLLNARKAVESVARNGDGGHSAIGVEVSGNEENVILVVKDSGPGVSPERLRTLFRPFRSGTSGGFGIGLYESKRIVESYGGTLRLESAPGSGTRVTVELPAVAPTEGVGQTAEALKEQ